jgi:hypothetical protein
MCAVNPSRCAKLFFGTEFSSIGRLPRALEVRTDESARCFLYLFQNSPLLLLTARAEQLIFACREDRVPSGEAFGSTVRRVQKRDAVDFNNQCRHFEIPPGERPFRALE